MWSDDRANSIRVSDLSNDQNGQIRIMLIRSENNENRDKNRGKIVTKVAIKSLLSTSSKLISDLNTDSESEISFFLSASRT